MIIVSFARRYSIVAYKVIAEHMERSTMHCLPLSPRRQCEHYEKKVHETFLFARQEKERKRNETKYRNILHGQCIRQHCQPRVRTVCMFYDV